VGWDPSAYGRHFADIYDEWYPDRGEAEQVVRLLRRLSPPPGVILEWGVGTGRLAIPLAGAGWEVHGVDASSEMLGLLADRCARTGLTVHPHLAELGSSGPVPVAADVVLAACNFVFNLPDADALTRALQHARAQLTSGGMMVLDAVVPAQDPPEGVHQAPGATPCVTVETVVTVEKTGTIVRGVHRGPDGQERPWQIRLVHPDELDRLAGDVGLNLAHRWEDWSGSPYEPGSSPRHISVYAP
jgi:hypothetical protein